MNVVFISILTFSDLDIALSSSADVVLVLACGLLPENKLHSRHCFSSSIYSCLSLLSGCHEHYPRVHVEGSARTCARMCV